MSQDAGKLVAAEGNLHMENSVEFSRSGVICDSPSRLQPDAGQSSGAGSWAWQHWQVLLMCSFVVVAAFLLEVAPDGETVFLRNTPRAALPPLCMVKRSFGVRCPGCGLTRSFIFLAEGDVAASWRSHRLGWLLAAVALVQVPYRLHELVRPGRRGWKLLWARWMGLAVFVLLVGNYLVSLLW